MTKIARVMARREARSNQGECTTTPGGRAHGARPGWIVAVACAMGLPSCILDNTESVEPAEITIQIFGNRAHLEDEASGAALVAFQDGDGPWLALDGTGGSYRAVTATRRYGVAVVCTYAEPYPVARVRLVYRTASESSELELDDCPATAAATSSSEVMLQGELQGIPRGEYATVETGSLRDGFASGRASDGSYRMPVPRGLRRDVFARSYRAETASNEVPSKLYRGPTLDLNWDRRLDIDLDIDGRPAETRALALPALPATDYVFVSTGLVTQLSSFTLSRRSHRGDRPTTYDTIAPSLLQPDDLVVLHVHVDSVVRAASPHEYRGTTTHMATARPMTMTLSAPWLPDRPAVVREPYARPTATFPITAPTMDRQIYSFGGYTYREAGTARKAEFRDWQVSFSHGWAAGATSVVLTTPDLSGLRGWRPEMALEPGRPIHWSMERVDSSVASPSHASDGDRSMTSGTWGVLEP